MSAKNRYWDHERCAWVAYDAAAASATGGTPVLPSERLPEQRADDGPAPGQPAAPKRLATPASPTG